MDLLSKLHCVSFGILRFTSFALIPASVDNINRYTNEFLITVAMNSSFIQLKDFNSAVAASINP